MNKKNVGSGNSDTIKFVHILIFMVFDYIDL